MPDNNTVLLRVQLDEGKTEEQLKKLVLDMEATRKAQDVGSWTRALGGVHALALTELEETSDPAAVLELGIPVCRLGGRPATPRAWATLLTGRLAA